MVPGYSESFEIGSGASGRVVLAVHEGTGVPVAVKYLSESLRTRPGFVHGFRAEAELLGGVRSPHVVRLYEYVEATRGAAIVMELVDGVSLRTLLAREGRLAPEAALVVLRGSLLGLADAHRAGVVHRDYKPENVLVSPEGVSKLVDFGIAVDAGVRAGVAGTPAYMAPEQWTGAPASPATDVYAATATFFECLTGRKPFAGDNLVELALQHVEGEVPVEEVPEAVRSLVERGLAKSTDRRPADAAAFVAELEEVATASYGDDWEERGRGRLAALVTLLLFLRPAAAPGTPHTATDTARTVLGRGGGGGRLGPWRPSWRGVAVSAAAVLLALLTALTDRGAGADAAGDAGRAAAVEALATTSASPDAGAGAIPSAAAAPPSSAAPATTAPFSPAAPAPGAATGVPDPPTESATASASPSTDPPDPGPSSSGPTPPDTGGPTTAAPSSPAAPTVKDIAVAEFRQTGPTTATATLTVTTDGTGPLTVTVGWSTGNTAGQTGTGDGEPVLLRRDGATRYTLTVDHTFTSTGCYWSVQATTGPASADGGASRQLLTRRCELR
ncbi:serine/threonine-protein kinase [Streptomyces sp. A012304]|uniref:serine/threonine-protein kinase n=1 Tax=Streptomyces sp. A012304 TaxID=375446 RepID=UPI00222E4E4E|nr:serine/threonine-protein kinase [Streptomyces sp. A012304]